MHRVDASPPGVEIGRPTDNGRPVPDEMRRDIRETAMFLEAERLWEQANRSGDASIADICDLQRSPDPSSLLFTGTVVACPGEPGVTRICLHDLRTGSAQLLTSGPGSDRHARQAPDGRTVAFLSDRRRPGDFQLFLLDWNTREVTPGPAVDGWIETLEWSPDGGRILLVVAGHGAELSSGQGAVQTDQRSRDEPGWLPRVIGSATDEAWRSAWVVDLATGDANRVSRPGRNIWEASWCGRHRLAVVVSDSPEEGAWYAAGVMLLDPASGDESVVHQSPVQVGLPRSSPSGHSIAFIEALASDRGFVAGDIRLCDTDDGGSRTLDLGRVDATDIAWTSDTELLVAGHRGLETIVLAIDVAAGTRSELWTGSDVTGSGYFAHVVGLDRPRAFAFVRESFFHRPRIATGTDHPSLASDEPGANADAEQVRWRASDGLEIEGWLLRPRRAPPYPVIVDVHGGPVMHWRPYWLGRSPTVSMLLSRGYAIFMPNPRGSSGRGRAFAARVLGDIGGADAGDILSGLDHLVAAGLADLTRLGIMGLSYGGFMACWLPTLDPRFRAAVAVGPATNHVTQHLLGNIPQFNRLFIGDSYKNLGGAYYARSPLLHVHAGHAPTLLVCGELDRCTPAAEALQFHRALSEHGAASVVITYPQEGHGVRQMPAAADFAARCVMWFEHHIPTSGP